MRDPMQTVKLIKLKRSYLRLPRCQLCMKMASSPQPKVAEPQETEEATEEDGQVD